MYLTVSIIPSHMESPTRSSQAPCHSNSASLHFTLKLFLLLLPPFIPHQNLPSPLQRLQQVLKSSAHAIFPLQTKFPFLEIAQLFPNIGNHIPLKHMQFQQTLIPFLDNHNGVQNTRTNSSNRQTKQTNVTNNQAATHESWLVRCYPHTLEFSQSNLLV